MIDISEPGSPRPVTPLGILADKLQRLVHQADAEMGADSWFASELRAAFELASGLDPYLSQYSTPESSALKRLAESTHTEDWRARSGSGALEQEMLSGHIEGQTLKMLVHATRARHVLDIGMFTGYSALAMAEALPDGGQVVACEIDAQVAAFAQRCFRESTSGHKIVVEVGSALLTLRELSATGQVFDLIFIDADKAGYVSYLNILLDTALLAPHGLICVDNTLMQGQPWVSDKATANGQAIAEFNRVVAADPRVEQVIIPLRDGLTLIRRVPDRRSPLR